MYIRTFTSHSSIFRVATVCEPDTSSWLSSAVQQTILISPTHKVIQKNGMGGKRAIVGLPHRNGGGHCERGRAESSSYLCTYTYVDTYMYICIYVQVSTMHAHYENRNQINTNVHTLSTCMYITGYIVNASFHVYINENVALSLHILIHTRRPLMAMYK